MIYIDDLYKEEKKEEKKTWASWIRKSVFGNSVMSKNRLQLAQDEIDRLRSENEIYREEIAQLRSKQQNQVLLLSNGLKNTESKLSLTIYINYILFRYKCASALFLC